MKPDNSYNPRRFAGLSEVTQHTKSDSIAFARLHADLEKVYALSSVLDYPFTIDEVTNYFLPNENLSGPQLKLLITTGNFADIPFQIQNGYLFTKPSQSENSLLERGEISTAKLESAARFAGILSRLGPFIRTVAVTGSVAYGCARKWDDIDLFLVTQKNRLWTSLLMALLVVRAYKLLGLAAPHLMSFCLSYVHDQDGFKKEAMRNQVNPLFARELLKAKPVIGEAEYRRILQENDWVGRMYPKPYASKLSGLGDNSNRPASASWSLPALILDWTEFVIYALLSRYLKLRAYLTNLRLKSERSELRIFEPSISPNSCVYTSNFYKWLHALWGEI